MFVTLECGLVADWDTLAETGNGRHCPLTGAPLDMKAVERHTFAFGAPGHSDELRRVAVEKARALEAAAEAGVESVRIMESSALIMARAMKAAPPVNVTPIMPETGSPS